MWFAVIGIANALLNSISIKFGRWILELVDLCHIHVRSAKCLALMDQGIQIIIARAQEEMI